MTFTIQLSRWDIYYYYVVYRVFLRIPTYFVPLIAGGYETWSIVDQNKNHPNQEAVWRLAILYGSAFWLGLFAFMVVFLCLVYSFRILRLKQDGSILEPKEVTVDETGLCCKGQDTLGKLAWNQFSSVSAGRRLVTVRLRGGLGQDIVFPKKDVPRDAVDAMKEYIKAAKDCRSKGTRGGVVNSEP